MPASEDETYSAFVSNGGRILEISQRLPVAKWRRSRTALLLAILISSCVMNLARSSPMIGPKLKAPSITGEASEMEAPEGAAATFAAGSSLSEIVASH